MYVNEYNENLWDFEVLDGVNFLNCNRIHPLKQKQVQHLVNCCEQDKQICELLVFGSSTDFRCNSRSDIDLVLIRDDDKKEAPYGFTDIESDYDLFFTVGERLKKVLFENGVCVYRRD
ncbi:MAG: hypothetical protein PUC39_08520 [Lachnospiraceae bacterium]|nr:hypothetical protein [Lachnospiraceae bacterium]